MTIDGIWQNIQNFRGRIRGRIRGRMRGWIQGRMSGWMMPDPLYKIICPDSDDRVLTINNRVVS